MIEIKDNSLLFSYPRIHPKANLRISFKRTLRIPDDGNKYPLPAALDSMPIRHVDDFANQVPPNWSTHGGVILPMYQSEAMILFFESSYSEIHEQSYKFAVQIGSGKINVISGKEWSERLISSPQNYIVIPHQYRLDGFHISQQCLRQFVAIPLGKGYTVEKQITGEEIYGGIQIKVFPMKRSKFDEYFNDLDFGPGYPDIDLGFEAGGMVKQEILKDPCGIDSWDVNNTNRCFVHIANSLEWKTITGENPTHLPISKNKYKEFGIPWYKYYTSELNALNVNHPFASLKSISHLSEEENYLIYNNMNNNLGKMINLEVNNIFNDEPF